MGHHALQDSHAARFRDAGFLTTHTTTTTTSTMTTTSAACAMLVSAKVGLAHEGRGDTSAVEAAVDFRLGLLDCRGDASFVAVEAPADDDRGIRRWVCTHAPAATDPPMSNVWFLLVGTT